jgi:predicted RNA binding protein YcfA (HicA-like mRNA interferase family)
MKILSGKDFCRVLEKNGWTLIRVRGSHRRYEKEGAGAVTVPVHGKKSLKKGLQRAIMKAAGLTDDDL